MGATEPAGAAAHFTRWFRSLATALGERPGWYAVFAAREPGAARAYRDGTDLPPWDVVHALLHDLAATRGAPPREHDLARARALHQAAIAAWDAVPGAAPALRARLDAAVRARDAAILREREALRSTGGAAAHPGGPDPAAARPSEVLARARDDRQRAVARCEELNSRLVALTSGPAGRPLWRDEAARAVPESEASQPPVPAASWPGEPAPGRNARAAGPRGARFAGAYRERGGETPAAPGSAAVAPTAPDLAPRSAPRGARFAGAPAAPVPAAPTAPSPRTADPASAPTARATGPLAAAPRGARFAGAPGARVADGPRPVDPRWTAEAGQTVARLGELRRTGHSGAAYVALCEAAAGPPDRLPYLVAELERAGFGADVATLLWETAALPAAAVAAAATALAGEGRPGECRTLLHQAAARPPADVAAVAAGLTAGGNHAEAEELLETLARSRSTQDAAEVVRARPSLARALLAASARISASRRRDILAALRRAGLPDS